MLMVIIGAAGVGLASYMVGRVHGYDKYEQIEKESKVWATK
jgi:hypothetical protein